MEPEEKETLKKWIDDQVGIAAFPEASEFLIAESKLMSKLIFRLHTTDIDLLEEPLLTLDLSSE